MITVKELRNIFNSALSDWKVQFTAFDDRRLWFHLGIHSIFEVIGTRVVRMEEVDEDYDTAQNSGDIFDLITNGMGDDDLVQFEFEKQPVKISLGDLGHSDKVIILSIDLD